MILSGGRIVELVEAGVIKIDPFDPARVNPNSYNMSVGDSVKVYAAQLRYLEGLRYSPTANDVLWRHVTVREDVPRDVRFAAARLAMRRPDETVLDPYKVNETVEIPIPRDGLDLWPGVLYIGATVEWNESPWPYAPVIEGRSTWGRLGVSVHSTAGFGDCGFKGRWVLEVSALTPVRVRPGDVVCQVAFHETTEPRSEYRGRYQGQDGPVAARPLG